MHIFFFSFLRSYTNLSRGQLLVEAMVAISIIVSGLLGVMILLSSSLGLNKVVSEQYIAIYLASEGIEVVRNIVDTNVKTGGFLAWNNGVLNCSAGCVISYDDLSLSGDLSLNPVRFDGNYYNHTVGEDTNFNRVVTVKDVDSSGNDILEVTSGVSWVGRSGGEFSVTLVDYFYNWR